MACRKQGKMQNHITPMKTRIAALVLAAGILTAGALADDSPATSTSAAVPASIVSPAPALDQIADTPHLPGAVELYGSGAAQGLAARQPAPSENDAGVSHHAGNGHVIAFSYHVQVLPDTGSFLAPVRARTVVVSVPPSPVFDYDTEYPALWFPSVSFRFDFGRHHHS